MSDANHDAWLVDLDGTLYRPKPVKLLMAAELALLGWGNIKLLQRFRHEHEALREQLAERLRAAGYAVDCAANGQDGEHIGLEYPIDAAIVDLGLPDKSGSSPDARFRVKVNEIELCDQFVV